MRASRGFSHAILAGLLIACLGLAACGRKGPLEAPPTGSWNDLADTPHSPAFGVVEVPPPLPVAVTQPAEQSMPGSARLNGQANPNGSPTLAWFEWGTSLAYGNVTPPQSVGSGSNAVGLSNVIVGLSSGDGLSFRAAPDALVPSAWTRTFNRSNQRTRRPTWRGINYTTARLRGKVIRAASPRPRGLSGERNEFRAVMARRADRVRRSNLNVVSRTTVGDFIRWWHQWFGPGLRRESNVQAGSRPRRRLHGRAATFGYWSHGELVSGPACSQCDALCFSGLAARRHGEHHELTDKLRSITLVGPEAHLRGNPSATKVRVLSSAVGQVIACDLILSAHRHLNFLGLARITFYLES